MQAMKRSALTSVAMIIGCLISPLPALAQGTGTKPVRTVIALGRLSSVVESPMHFRLLRVELPPKATATHRGPNGLVYPLAEKLDLTLDGAQRTLDNGEGLYIPSGANVTFVNFGERPAVFLHFLLVAGSELDGRVESAPANVTELHRMTIPRNALNPGPYELSMVRVTLPAAAPAPPLHMRSGAALYYVLEGGFITFDGKTEPRPRGAIQEEPYGFIHAWSSSPDAPLVLLQANLSQEGMPEIIFVK